MKPFSTLDASSDRDDLRSVRSGCAIVQDIQNRQATAREERERAELRRQALVEHSVYRSAGRLEESNLSQQGPSLPGDLRRMFRWRSP